MEDETKRGGVRGVRYLALALIVGVGVSDARAAEEDLSCVDQGNGMRYCQWPHLQCDLQNITVACEVIALWYTLQTQTQYEAYSAGCSVAAGYAYCTVGPL